METGIHLRCLVSSASKGPIPNFEAALGIAKVVRCAWQQTLTLGMASSAKKSRGPASLTCCHAVNRNGLWPPARGYLQETPRLPLAAWLPQTAVKSDWHTGSNSDNRRHVSDALKKVPPEIRR